MLSPGDVQYLLAGFPAVLPMLGVVRNPEPGIKGPKGNPGEDGEMVGPAKSGDTDVAIFDGVTGKKLKDSGIPIIGVASSGSAGIDEGQGWAWNGTAAVGDDRPVDVWNTQANPAAIVDWGPIINALLAEKRGNLYLGPHDFPYKTQLALVGPESIKLVGAGAVSGAQQQGSAATRMIWKGKGAGSPQAFNNETGVYCCDVAWLYDSEEFTGRVLDFGENAGNTAGAFRPVFERCRIGALGFIFSALTCVAVHTSVSVTLRDCVIGGMQTGVIEEIGGGQYCVLGRENVGETYADELLLDSCSLGRATVAQVGNPYDAWRFNDVIWEMFDTPAAILSNLGANAQTNFTVTGGWMGDSGGAGIPFQLGVGDIWNASFYGLRANLTTEYFDLQGGGNISIIDCPITAAPNKPIVDCGDVSKGAVRKNSIRIKGGGWVANGAEDLVINRKGHHKVTVEEMAFNSGTLEQNTFDGHDSNGYINNSSFPTIEKGPALGGAGAKATIFGNDRAGAIRLELGEAPAAGVLATINFADPYLIEELYNPTAGVGADVPLADIWPVDLFGVVAGPAFAAQCHPYYPNNSKTSFQIKCVNVPGGQMALGYRVIGI